MSIARDEAEHLYPIHRAGDDMAGFIQPAIDVLSQDAYEKGRTARPCSEQVEAVTRLLWEDSSNLEPFEEVADAPEIIDEYRRWASTLLEAARKAVM